MAIVKPFYCIRPKEDAAPFVAALPYDVYNREEAKKEVENTPLSFLRIDRAETQFDDSVDTYDDCVYEKARELLDNMLADGTFITEDTPCFYLYELTMDGRSQTGIVACSSVEDYLNGVVKRHENTREDKELDRIRHVDVTSAQTGPIFLAYRGRDVLKQLIQSIKQETPIYDFISPDGVGHRVFRIAEEQHIKLITEEFSKVDCTYIADGHHRAASAVKVAQMRGEEQSAFLSVLFSEEELQILPYNRVVKDLNGLSNEAFFKRVQGSFDLAPYVAKPGQPQAYEPEKKGCFGMCIAGNWYVLRAKADICSEDPVKGLDASLLQDHLLAPILGIADPRTDKRIEFIGGIRGTKELERRVLEDMTVAFSMYPTSMEELLAVADAGLLMPPKSTWFEPKLRSGLFINRI